ncbi:N-acetylmuramoyl-L-alanine amidase [Paenibacillus sp. Root52]|uniref:N-acetylmuramoyl-L-alanine amidase n=1 Tax=Paenibacillus amylolyticus TaxID=1451 RepID=A0AAP5LKE0_PAEAM|nr:MULTISPECIES: N-acetylmuramoyl-L-alanine amidase family protein [Paenibacillus]KQY87819.1 N-acetylmuramoyl-L-alanine amidase [Paenibacillus sp. Root52]MCG7375508.1 N-acetylmuramoyl-L-alanine amidase family protein [Paenibacillus sp. ACRSA]MDR6722077.1 N-acetylmuramoyl-L-alanine amidase [Paenibacillus amylolyticus]
MKKFGFLVLLFVFGLVFPGYSHAATDTKIILDGKEIVQPSDAKAENINSSVMVPIRVISESLGYGVDWQQKTSTVTISKDNTAMQMIVGQKTATVNGSNVNLDVPPLVKNGTTLVPLRFVGEQMGLKVGWNNTTKTVTLVTQNSGSGNGTTTPPNSGNNSGDTQEGLVLVNGISFSDNRFLIATSGDTKPNVFTMTGPDRIVIDLPNTAFADSFSQGQALDSNQNGQLVVNGYPDVSKIRYSLYSNTPSTVRFVIDLSGSKGYDVQNDSGLVIVDLNKEGATPQPPVGNNGKKVVVVDAGHGDQDPGAIGVTGKREKDFNLAMALKVEALLKKESNIDVVLTRSDDTFLALKERVRIAESLKADIFISIHANSGPAAANGVETFYSRATSQALAKVMHKHLLQSSGLKDRGVKTASLHVTRETTMPAVLLEGGFLSNKSDEAALFTESFQNSVAKGIVAGIKEYLGIK